MKVKRIQQIFSAIFLILIVGGVAIALYKGISLFMTYGKFLGN